MTSALRSLLLRFQVFRDLREGRAQRLVRDAGMDFPVVSDYPFRSVPRYGHGREPHRALLDILGRRRQAYADLLRQFLAFQPDLLEIPLDPPGDPVTPNWRNNYFSGLDAVSLYALAAINDPRTYIEIGSGNSTKFMRRAIRNRRLQTRVLSIDPSPRASVDRLCDEVRRERLEETDLGVFDRLEAGDILFVDGSHRVFMNSDVTVVFLEILPRLRPGVLIYVDDIYLPLDYPPEWTRRYYSEQYILAAVLLADGPHYEVVLPCTYVRLNPDLQEVADLLWKGTQLANCGLGLGSGFWLRRR